MRRLRPAIVLILIALTCLAALSPARAQGPLPDPAMSAASTAAWLPVTEAVPASPAPAAPAGPPPPGTYFKGYAGSFFRPRYYSAQYDDSIWQLYQLTADTQTRDYDLPLDLPQGAQIQEVLFSFVDNDATRVLRFWLLRFEPITGAYTELAALSTSGLASSSSVGNVYVTSPLGLVDNMNYSYFLQARFDGGAGSNLRLVGARIAYSFATTSLPLVVR